MSQSRKLRPGEDVELNPQPIPPGRETIGRAVESPGVKIELNPQPIPPGHNPIHIGHDPHEQLLHGLTHDLGRHARATVHGGANGVSFHRAVHQHPSLVELGKRLKQKLPDPPPPQLPEQLGIWNAQIGFPDGVPVGGWANLTLHRDGRYAFNGHLHDTGAPRFNGALGCAVKAADGKALTLAAQGHMAGTFEAGSRDGNWSYSGSADAMAETWGALVRGWRYQWQAAVNVDLGGLINDLETGLQIAGQVIPIVRP
jgi:hypothetical protein